MPDLNIRKGLWSDFVALAEKQRKKPELLAQQVLKEYIERMEAEELLEYSARAARRAPFRVSQTEEIIREHRRTKRQGQSFKLHSSRRSDSANRKTSVRREE